MGVFTAQSRFSSPISLQKENSKPPPPTLKLRRLEFLITLYGNFEKNVPVRI